MSKLNSTPVPAAYARELDKYLRTVEAYDHVTRQMTADPSQSWAQAEHAAGIELTSASMQLAAALYEYHTA